MATKTRPQRPARTIIQSSPVGENDAAVATLPPAIDPAEILTATEIEDGQPTGATIFIPLAELPQDGYVRRFNNVDCRLTEQGHIDAFQKLFYCLNQNDTRLRCGKHIDNSSDVIKYLLENFTLSLAGS